ncbi:MAG: YlbF family regulator [candidate division KSB1 bacterium]|nr:YlbF family regulator [candidate division KSB1 bacterium]
MSNFNQNGDVRKGASEFAQILRSSRKISAFIEAQEKLNGDAEAKNIIDRFQTMQQLRATGSLRGQDYTEMVQVQQQLQRNPVIRDFIQTQQNAADFLQTVNMTISQILGIDFGATAGKGAGSC